jgi:hypothetical protein
MAEKRIQILSEAEVNELFSAPSFKGFQGFSLQKRQKTCQSPTFVAFKSLVLYPTTVI